MMRFAGLCTVLMVPGALSYGDEYGTVAFLSQDLNVLLSLHAT
jgi:hypothetical protein